MRAYCAPGLKLLAEFILALEYPGIEAEESQFLQGGEVIVFDEELPFLLLPEFVFEPEPPHPSWLHWGWGAALLPDSTPVIISTA